MLQVLLFGTFMGMAAGFKLSELVHVSGSWL